MDEGYNEMFAMKNVELNCILKVWDYEEAKNKIFQLFYDIFIFIYQ